MINLREVEDAIQQLENGSATYNNCMKLAALYIVRDEMEGRQGQRGMYTYGRYPYYYERGGRNGNSGNSSYGYKPMMYHNDEEDLMIRKDMMDYNMRG